MNIPYLTLRLYYYYDDTGGGASLSLSLDAITSGSLYPVPVGVLNLRIDNAYVNANSATFDDQLTRRFFIVDAASGVRTAGELPPAVRRSSSRIKRHTPQRQRAQQRTCVMNRERSG